jgi:serine/threonine protein kinase
MGSETSTTTGELRSGKYLAPGDTVADRFTITSFLGTEIVGESYIASDSKSDRPVWIQAVPTAVLSGPNAVERFKAEMRSASQLTHKNIVTSFGMGQLSPEAFYIAGEYVEGEKLRDVMQSRRAQGKEFSLRGAYNIIAHLCNALSFAHESRIHGSLSPATVIISKSGRVKISEFPLSRLLYTVPQMRNALPADAQMYWAPEVKASSTVITHRADVWSLGMMLFELLTGRIPEDPAARVSAARPDIPSGVDEIISRCLDAEPANRFRSTADLKEQLATLLELAAETEPPMESEDAGLDIEIDVDRPLSVIPPAAPGLERAAPPAHHAGPPKPPPPNKGGLPPMPRAHAEEEHRPSLGPLNLDALMSGVKDQDSEKWMVTKGKMDHGPFRTREVVQMISRWEVEGQHYIQNIETGIRCKVRESDDFKELVERARVEKVKQEEQAALEQSDKAEKRGGVAKIFVVLIVIGAIGLIVGSVFAVRAITKAGASEDESDIDELIASGELKIDMGGGGIVAGKKDRKGKRKGGGSGGGGGGGSAGGYDDYMNQAVNLGDVAGNGGQAQLTQNQINAIMSSKGKAIYPCIYGELKRNPSLKKVSLKFAIEGASGSVMGVDVTSGGSSEFQSCVAQKMKKIKFPTFSAPRMGATFFFNVG